MVSLTERDKKIVMLLVPIALIAAYWFLVLSPKKDESAKVQEQLTQAQSEQQDAESAAASVAGAKSNFASDYTTVVRLGKAIPSTVDMPSLMIQLDRAARGTDISFDKIQTGERQAAPAAAPASGGNSGSGAPAQSGPGQAKQAAQNAANTASNTGTLNGAQPGAAGSNGSAGAGAGAPGLESIGLDFTFHGTFFNLADFFHRMKRFVRVANEDIVVRGRLMTIDQFKWKAEPDKWPFLTAEVHATVYLAPKAEGVSAGATPQGPGATPAPTPASGSTPAPSSSPATTAPAATVK
jgi:Tfp pilus assembly protein PilO